MLVEKSSIDTKFRCLEVGDAYKFGNEVYIKTEYTTTKNGLAANAVCLNNGGLMYFGGESIVIPTPNAKVVYD